jgi:hypothetical protein
LKALTWIFMKSETKPPGSKYARLLVLSDRWIFVLLFSVSLILYILLPVAYPPEPSVMCDSVEYAMQAESSNLTDVFHPHHLFNAAFHRIIWLGLGGTDSSIRIVYLMRWTSHLCMAWAVALLFLIARRMGGSKILSAMISLGFATGCSPWMFGSVAEVVAPSCALFLFITLRIMYRRDKKPIGNAELWFLGWLFGLNVTWSHIVVIYFPILWVMLWSACKPYKIRAIKHFTASAFLWLLISYLGVAFLLLNVHSLSGFWDFITYYVRQGMGGKGITIKEPVVAIRTILITQSYSFLKPETLFHGVGAVLATAGTALLAVLGCAGWIWGKSEKSNDRPAIIFLWLISLGFILWWLPSAWDYWVMPWSFLLLGIIRLRFRNGIPYKIIIAAAFLAANIYNLTVMVLPRTRDIDNPYFRLATSMSVLPDQEITELFTTDLYICPYARYWAHVSRAYHYIEQAPGLLPANKQAQFLEHLTGMIYFKIPDAIFIDGDVLKATLEYLHNQPGREQSLLASASYVGSQVYEGKQLDIYLVKSK